MKSKMRFNFEIFSLIVIFFITGTTFAKTNLPQLTKAELTNISQSLPQLQQFTIEQFEPDGKNGQFKYTILIENKTGNISIKAISTDFETVTRTNSSLQIIDSVVLIKDKNIIKKYSLDKIENVYNREKQAVIVKEFFNDQLKKTKEHRYSLEIYQLPDFGVMELFLQSMLVKGVTCFNHNIVMDEKKYNVDFCLEKVNSVPDSSKYKYPDKFIKFLKNYDQFYLYSAEATGVIKLAFPHKFYYAYENSPPYTLIATWGGDPKECVYKIYNKL